MQIYYNLEDIPVLNRDSVVTFGVFDGLHLGHQAVIRQVVEDATARDLSSTVLAFYPHPMAFLSPERCPPILTPRQKRLELLEALGVEIAIFVRFDAYLAEMSPSAFVQAVLIGKLRARQVIVGYACQFGKNRTGNATVLQSLGAQSSLDVTIMPPTLVEGMPVHSTRVREAVVQGELDLAAHLLERPHSIIGRIVRGDGRGRQFGYPTANIHAEDQICPPNGVYAIRAKLKDRLHEGILNMGLRPTVDGLNFQIEAHLFNFNEDVYGREIEIFFIKKVRDERKFADVESLVEQIGQDVKIAQDILGVEA
ncbi:MAG: bifunctional riboflavin kinase/FAD synthetase [Candidatus Poribacteria bacterium]|nr:bifunctional riboflavin kinase/FAD synthetase [Candidatus Poribacteria bacterium]